MPIECFEKDYSFLSIEKHVLQGNYFFFKGAISLTHKILGPCFHLVMENKLPIVSLCTLNIFYHSLSGLW